MLEPKGKVLTKSVDKVSKSFGIEHFDTLIPSQFVDIFSRRFSLRYRALWHFIDTFSRRISLRYRALWHLKCQSARYLRGNRRRKVSMKCQSARYLRGNCRLKVSMKCQSVKVLDIKGKVFHVCNKSKRMRSVDCGWTFAMLLYSFQLKFQILTHF